MIEEFDSLNRPLYKWLDKKNITVEERLSEIEKSINSAKDMLTYFKKYRHDKIHIVELMFTIVIDDIVDFFNYCNNSKDDTETRWYLGRLMDLHTKSYNMIDEI